MPKAKSKATVMAADGSGGLAKVQDRRFEQGDWPIRFEVPNEQADTWLRYFSAECESRGWNSSSFGQMEARENSGSVTVNIGGADKASLAVVWERKRERPMNVRARSAGVPEFPLAEAQELFERVGFAIVEVSSIGLMPLPEWFGRRLEKWMYRRGHLLLIEAKKPCSDT